MIDIYFGNFKGIFASNSNSLTLIIDSVKVINLNKHLPYQYLQDSFKKIDTCLEVEAKML